MAPRPTVYLVGAGPQDAKLITLRGLELIKKAGCIIYDYLVNPVLLKSAPADCKLIYVGKKAGAHTLAQDGINRLLVKEARAHDIVVRLKGGDPFIFGRGAEEARYLKNNQVNFEVVPGVSSAIAVPAYAGIPLTERSRNSTVGFITGHEDPFKTGSAIDWKALAKALGTMVFLMGVGNLDAIAKQLLAAGKPKDTPVALIMRGTTARQKTITGSLGNIAGLARKNNITPPAIIVVGESVGLRKELNWFETKPLFAKRLIVTRTREQASRLSERLSELGAEVVEVPTIKTISLNADKYLKDAFLTEKYDWVFFTSQNGVIEFAAFLERQGKDSRIFGTAKICAIGSETAKRLRVIGVKPDYVPQEFVAESVVRHFKKIKIKSAAAPKALILRAKIARDVLPRGLKEAGFAVKIIDLYDTLLVKESAPLLKEAFREEIDLVTFTSSSTAKNFARLLGRGYRRKLSGVKIASIGPITSATLRKLGLKVNIEAKAHNIEGLVQAISRSKV